MLPAKTRAAGRKLGVMAVLSALAPPAIAAASSPPTTLAAARRSGSIQLDGRADEPAWAAAAEGGSFRQSQPDEGAPASAATRFRVLWDNEALYVAVDI